VLAIIALDHFRIVPNGRAVSMTSVVYPPVGSAVEPLSIRTLGGLSIWQGDAAQPMRFETRTVDALLVYLACHDRPMARDFVAELLWPERTQKQARSNLNVAIHRLRRKLEPYLLVTRQSLALARHAPIHVDSGRFEGHMAAGHLVEAVSLYGGDFLDSFYLDSSPAFEQWILLERERLSNLAIFAYQQLVIQASASGQIESAIAHAERLLRLDPLHEPTHRQLMRLLARVGRRAAALAQYTICCQLLDRELGAPPDETTTALYEQIRGGALEAALRDPAEVVNSAGAVLRPSSSPVHHPVLPPQSTTLIGREAELAQIGDLLANPDCRLLTLLGVGGIGKTRLAVESAARYAGSFADGVCYISLASVGTAGLVPATLAQHLGIQPGSSDILGQLDEYLRPRHILLVLDNFEHLLEAAEMVAHLLHSAPRVKALVTSRERLYLLEEWLLPITGLSLAAGAASEASQLFVRSAQRVQPAFTPEGQEAAIAAICRQVEGMPLALELAASWVRVMPCVEIAHQIRHNLDLLTTSLRNVPERHRNLRSLFDHSWRLLNRSEQAVLMRLSVFRGGWTLEQAAEVAGATLPLLLSLVEKSLVRTSGQSRFDLHELVRQYAAEQLAASGEVDLIRQSHYRAYLGLARAADSRLRGAEAVVWHERLEFEHDNLRAALQWAFDQERYADATWLGVALHHFWYAHGYWYEGAKWLEPLLPRGHMLGAELHLATLLAVYTYWRALEDFQSIDQHMGEVMQSLEVCPHKVLCAAGWQLIAVSTSDFSQAVVIWEKCIILAREAVAAPGPGSEFGIFADGAHVLAEALFRYAIRLIDVGEYGRAAQFSVESIEIFQTQGNRDFIAYGFGNLGRLALLRGDVDQASTLLHEAVTLAAAVGNRLGLIDWQPRLGIVMLYRGDATEARRLLSETLKLCIGRKSVMILARIYTYLAETELWEGELEQAEQWLAQSLAHYAHPRWIRLDLVDSLWVAARLATAHEHYRRAAILFGLAEQLGSQIRYAPVEPVRVQIDAALATVQQALGAEQFAQDFTLGRGLSLQEAFSTTVMTNHNTSISL
jgi:predicted ATPase/DNA-binding SARP family transcriptional activator